MIPFVGNVTYAIPLESIIGTVNVPMGALMLSGFDVGDGIDISFVSRSLQNIVSIK